ncbi:MAG TPA: D-alanyl-D-alanine-carboxypeptidase/endopeptidase AmpH [Caulobacteraceae bacterium]|nr:D-alanyl-D-alanine-carboxypeptidase/endopeptidase AmpH [Caulobacteraceae bacterium]
MRRSYLLQAGRRVAGAVVAAGVLFAPVACHRATAPQAAAPTKVAVAAPSGVREAMASLYAASEAQGMVVTVVDGDSVTTQGFGRMGPKDPRTPDGRTLVRLQSISKLFSSELLATMAAQGRVRLDDALQAHAPPGSIVPQPKNGPPITLLSLATHTSGLPREAGIDPPPPDAAIAARWAWLVRERGRPAPGRQALYSNVGFELLGDALANAAGKSYNDALDQAVTGPLGMVDTTARPTAEECARLMSPDLRRGTYPCIDQTPEAASGGLYSTADDMALWMKAQLAAGPAGSVRGISQAVYIRRDTLARAVGIDHAGPASGIGLAWIEEEPDDTHPRILEKTGGGDGFLTYIVIDPVHRIGIFVAFNNESGHRLPIVARDANVLVGELGARRRT